MRRFALLLPLFAILACGGSSSSSIADPATGDGGTGDGAAGDGGTSGGTTYTLDNVCELTAPKICALRKPCCEKSFGFDEATCLANVESARM